MNLMGNSHADISLKGFLDEEASEEVMSGFMENEPLKIWAGEKLFFAGIISNV